MLSKQLSIIDKKVEQLPFRELWCYYIQSPFLQKKQNIMNLSFTQRLQKASKGRVDKTPNRNNQTKTQTQANSGGGKLYDFKKHHSDLKGFLKLLEGEKNPQFDQLTPKKSIKQKSLEKPSASYLKKQCTKENYGNKIHIGRKSFEKPLKNANKVLDFLPDQRPFEHSISFINSLRSCQNTPRKKDDETSSQKNSIMIEQKPKKRGIPNSGNTCYINAILQCLFHLPEFNTYFSKDQDEAQMHPKNKGVVKKYKSLFKDVMSKESSVQISTLPLKRSVSKICSLFIDFQQQDAHEFMRQLLDSMHQDLNLVYEKSSYKILETNSRNRNLYSLGVQYWNYYKNIDDSYIYDCFCGQICNSITCSSCHHESITFDNFLDLSVPMVKGKDKLDHLLQAYFDSETLSDFYSCSVCKKKVKNSIKTSQLWRAPKYLIVHLKRSQFGRKNNDKVQIPVRCLDMKQFMKSSNDKSAKQAMYSLQGAVLHRGVIDGGHYWAQVRQGSNWYTIDDEKVTENKQIHRIYQNQGNQYAYILYYKSIY